MTDRVTVVGLSDGRRAHLVAVDDGWSLVVDGIAQSHLGADAAAPRDPHVRWMVATLAGVDGPLHCAHLGGALLTIPRAVAVLHPGSRQVVVELEAALAELVRTRFAVGEDIEVVTGDARAWLDAGGAEDLDALFVDVFAGTRIPPAFTSLECFRAAAATLASSGRLVVNSVSDPGFGFLRRELATLRAVFAHVAVVSEPAVLAGERFGNAVLVASPSPLPWSAIRTAVAGADPAARLFTDLAAFVGDAAPITDADGLVSPPPTAR